MLLLLLLQAYTVVKHNEGVSGLHEALMAQPLTQASSRIIIEPPSTTQEEVRGEATAGLRGEATAGLRLYVCAYRIMCMCMTQETVRRLPFRCYTRKGSDLDRIWSQQRKR